MEMNFRAWMSLGEAVPARVADPWAALRAAGASRLGGRQRTLLPRADFTGMAADVRRIDPQMDFSRTRAYLEAVPPVGSIPGWACLAVPDEDAWMVAWTPGGNEVSQVLDAVRAYMADRVADWAGEKDRRFEEEAFGYSGDNNAGFDEILAEWRKMRDSHGDYAELANITEINAFRRVAALHDQAQRAG